MLAPRPTNWAHRREKLALIHLQSCLHHMTRAPPPPRRSLHPRTRTKKKSQSAKQLITWKRASPIWWWIKLTLSKVSSLSKPARRTLYRIKARCITRSTYSPNHTAVLTSSRQWRRASSNQFNNNWTKSLSRWWTRFSNRAYRAVVSSSANQKWKWRRATLPLPQPLSTNLNWSWFKGRGKMRSTRLQKNIIRAANRRLS